MSVDYNPVVHKNLRKGLRRLNRICRKMVYLWQVYEIGQA